MFQRYKYKCTNLISRVYKRRVLVMIRYPVRTGFVLTPTWTIKIGFFYGEIWNLNPKIKRVLRVSFLLIGGEYGTQHFFAYLDQSNELKGVILWM